LYCQSFTYPQDCTYEKSSYWVEPHTLSCQGTVLGMTSIFGFVI